MGPYAFSLAILLGLNPKYGQKSYMNKTRTISVLETKTLQNYSNLDIYPTGSGVVVKWEPPVLTPIIPIIYCYSICSVNG